jgi:hypothetical protein
MGHDPRPHYGGRACALARRQPHDRSGRPAQAARCASRAAPATCHTGYLATVQMANGLCYRALLFSPVLAGLPAAAPPFGPPLPVALPPHPSRTAPPPPHPAALLQHAHGSGGSTHSFRRSATGGAPPPALRPLTVDPPLATAADATAPQIPGGLRSDASGIAGSLGSAGAILPLGPPPLRQVSGTAMSGWAAAAPGPPAPQRRNRAASELMLPAPPPLLIPSTEPRRRTAGGPAGSSHSRRGSDSSGATAPLAAPGAAIGMAGVFGSRQGGPIAALTALAAFMQPAQHAQHEQHAHHAGLGAGSSGHMAALLEAAALMEGVAAQGAAAAAAAEAGPRERRPSTGSAAALPGSPVLGLQG